MDVTRCLRQFPTQFVSRAVHRATYACHMVEALRLGLICCLRDLVLDATGHSLQLVLDVRSAFVLAFVFHRSSPVGWHERHAPRGPERRPQGQTALGMLRSYRPEIFARCSMEQGGAAKWRSAAGGTPGRGCGVAFAPGRPPAAAVAD